MSTALKTRCPACEAAVKVTETHLGKHVRCPACKQPFEVASVEVSLSGFDSLDRAQAAEETISERARDTSPLPADQLPAGSSQSDGPKPAGGSKGKATSAAAVPKSKSGTRPAERATLGQLGRFQLQELLGQGAFGKVYRAYDPQLDRLVALKVPTFGPEDERKILRFTAEAKAAAKLRHPNIVPTYESGSVDGQYYIAAQFVNGQTLSQRIKAGPVEFRQAADCVRQLADALAYAHKQGIVHRDIKPDNIMLDEQGCPQIMDFGLAKRVNEDAGMTTDGSLLGTPAYMAPEQARGDHKNVGPASDQYSLGVVLYQLLTGRKPFEGPPHAVIAQVISTEPPTPRSLNPIIPKVLEAICQKGMSKEHGSRYECCSALSDDLARWLRGEPTAARPISTTERFFRWQRRNPVIAGLSAAVAIVTLIAFAIVSAALWRADQALHIANAARKAADDHLAEAKRQEAVALSNLEEANEQRAAAERNLKLANDRQLEAEAARRSAQEKAREAEANFQKLQAESRARQKSEADKTALEKSKTSLESLNSSLTKARDDAISQNEAQFYRDRIMKAAEAVAADKLTEAAQFLGACPEALRDWEWRYLQNKARANPLLIRMVALGFSPQRLQISQDGKYVAVGAQSTDKATDSLAWNVVWSPNYNTIQDFKIRLRSEHGGAVFSFSQDGSQILVVFHDPDNRSAHPQLWAFQNEWKLIREFKFLPRTRILGCGQNRSGNWLMIAQENNQVLLRDLVSGASQLICSGYGYSSFSRDMSLLFVVKAENGSSFGKLTTASTFSLESSLSRQSSDVQFLPPDVVTNSSIATLNSAFVNFAGPNCFCFGRNTSISGTRSTRATNTTGASSVSILVDGKLQPDLSRLANNGFAAFSPSGTRLFILTREKGVAIHDPRSFNPAQPLLEIPFEIQTSAGKSPATIAMDFHGEGNQVAFFFGQSLYYIDVSLEVVN